MKIEVPFLRCQAGAVDSIKCVLRKEAAEHFANTLTSALPARYVPRVQHLDGRISYRVTVALDKYDFYLHSELRHEAPGRCGSG